MQPWHIKALELEASGFKHLDGFIHEHALYFLVGAIYLFAGPTGLGIRRGIAAKRRKIHAPRAACNYHSPAGTTAAATRHV